MDSGMEIDAIALAKAKGITILYNKSILEIRGAAFQKDGNWYILINPDDTIERQNFTAAHELAEIEMSQREDLTLDERHRLSNFRAGEILLPENVFRPLLFQKSLYELKMIFPKCSYEVIARRSLIFRQSILTIMDNHSLTLRMASSEMNFPSRPDSVELKVIRECYAVKNMVKESGDQLDFEGFYIEVNKNIRRVILFTMVRDEDF